MNIRSDVFPSQFLIFISLESLLVRELFISDLLQANSRVQGIYGPLITENHELCESSSFNYLGATFFHSNQFSTDFQQAAGKILGSTEQVVVWDVFFGTPAATAGLQKGDLVLQVGNVKVGLPFFIL